MSFIATFLDLLFPPKCVFCGRVLNETDEGWCGNCVEALPFAENHGRQSGEYFDFCVSPLYYIDDVRRSILRYKFKGAVNFATVYGKLLADCISDCRDLKYDLITWVPLSGKHERSRGYDQAMLLAQATALALDDIAVETLKKPVDVGTQSELGDRAERSRNIKGAYVASDPDIIAGKRVLIIDDIVTTCSTLDECAGVLRRAGASGVVCATLARGT